MTLKVDDCPVCGHSFPSSSGVHVIGGGCGDCFPDDPCNPVVVPPEIEEKVKQACSCTRREKDSMEDEMEPKRYSIVLRVDMEGHTPEEAVYSVAESAEGWSYEVTDLETGDAFMVHLDNGDVQVEPIHS